MGGSFNGMNFDIDLAGAYNEAANKFMKGSSTGLNYGKRDFSWYDKILGRGEKAPEFKDVMSEDGKEVISSSHSQFTDWSKSAQERIKEANKIAYEKTMRGEISPEDYKKLMGQTGINFGGEGKTLGSYTPNYGSQISGLSKQQESFKKMRGGQASLDQLAPGIREQSGDVVKGLLRNQAKATILGKV